MIICVTLLKKEKRKNRERERKARGGQNFKRKPHALHIISTLPGPASFLLALHLYYTTARLPSLSPAKSNLSLSPHLNSQYFLSLSLSLSLSLHMHIAILSIFPFLCNKTLFPFISLFLCLLPHFTLTLLFLLILCNNQIYI